MSEIRTIFKNFSWLMASQIVTTICAVVWTFLIGRYLGVSRYGIMNFAISFTGIAGIIMDLGISTHVVRHIATDFDSSSKYLGNAIPLKSAFSILSFIIILIVLILMGCDELTIKITLLFTIERIFISMTGLLNGSLQAVEEGKYQAIGNILLNSLLLIFILITITFDFGLYGITLAYVISNFSVVISQYIAVKKRLSKPKFELDMDFCKKITLASLPFALTSLFSLVFVFPVMSRYYKNEKNLLVVSFEKSVKYLMLIFIPLSFAVMVYSQEIVVLFFGQEFLAASSPLSILMWTVSLTILGGVCSNLLNASHKEKYVTLILMASAIFNTIANLIIIPKYSYNGAALTTITTDIIGTSLFIYLSYKLNAVNKRLVVDLIKIFIGSIILYVSLIVLNLNMWIALPVGIIIYFCIILILKTFDDDDRYIIKEILSKK